MYVLVYAAGKDSDWYKSGGKIAITYMSNLNRFNWRYETEAYWVEPWDFFSVDYTITHWMPLPEVPNQTEKDKGTTDEIN